MSKKGKEAFQNYQRKKAELKHTIQDRQNKTFLNNEKLTSELLQNFKLDSELSCLPQTRFDFISFISSP